MRKIRLLLFPLSVIYDLITALRNFCFDLGIFQQYKPKVKTIAVGNLSTGGTGKTPVIEHLIMTYSSRKIGVVSRGYGRDTRGYIEVKYTHTASEVGDEPLQIKKKFGDQIRFAVSENRAVGIQKLTDTYDLDLILLDDAFQHRHVRAHIYILLTSYDRPYTSDYLLPAGDLRESRTGALRADHVVVTKCPTYLSAKERSIISKKICLEKYQQLHFTTISYSSILKGKTDLELTEVKQAKITLVTGIAKPQPLVDYLSTYFEVEHLNFSDHHTFALSEIETIKNHDFIITTEKDYMRLENYDIPNLYYLEMQMKFLESENPDFLQATHF
jgi:tetraacyldisaccharide 4'-kinase